METGLVVAMVIMATMRNLAHDLWCALGCDPNEFQAHIERTSINETWAALLSAVRQARGEQPCGRPTDEGEPCVLLPHRTGPHHGESDVGRSEPIPWRPAAPRPEVGPVGRVREYLEQRGPMRGVDPDVVHSLHGMTELRVSDLNALVRQAENSKPAVDAESFRWDGPLHPAAQREWQPGDPLYPAPQPEPEVWTYCAGCRQSHPGEIDRCPNGCKWETDEECTGAIDCPAFDHVPGCFGPLSGTEHPTEAGDTF